MLNCFYESCIHFLYVVFPTIYALLQTDLDFVSVLFHQTKSPRAFSRCSFRDAGLISDIDPYEL